MSVDREQIWRDADALDRRAQDIYGATNKTHLLAFCQQVVKACATQRRLLAELEQAERERDEARGLSERVGVANALRNLIAAAEPLIGKPQVVSGRVKLPPEWYPAASETIQRLREATLAAQAVLDDAAPLAEAQLAALVEALRDLIPKVKHADRARGYEALAAVEQAQERG